MHSVRWFVPIVSAASGVVLSGLYSTRGFTEAAGMAAGEMFTWALVGNVVGIFVLAPLWDHLPARVRVVGSLLSVASAYASFAVASGPAGFTVAAFVLGLASSMWIKVFNQAGEWLDDSIGAHRARGERVAWPTVGLAINMAQQLKALAMLLGAALAGSTWAGATPGLSSGWAGVSVQIGVAGTAMLVAALAVFLWRHYAPPYTNSPTEKGDRDDGRLNTKLAMMCSV